MNPHVIRQTGQVARRALDITDQQQEVREPLTRSASCGMRERIRGRIEAYGEDVAPSARDQERETPVSRSDVQDRSGERAG